MNLPSLSPLTYVLPVCILMDCFYCASVMAQDRWTDDTSGSPFNLSADKIEYDTTHQLYIARGNVTITKNNDTLSADVVQYNPKTMKASAFGNVILTSGEDIIGGSRIEMDMGTGTGSIYDGNLYFKKNHFHITGDAIRKVDVEEYAGEHVMITTCEGENPAWKITGKHLELKVEGYGSARHATLWIKRIPVLYSPYLVFPVKTNRQSGLLTPQIDYSDRLGFAFEQPLFWAINNHSDATFYGHYLSERGTKAGFEYRYILDPLSKGTIMVDVLKDRKVDDGRSERSADWGYEDDEVLRPNNDRYWFRMKHDHVFDNGFSAKLDLDIVSDQDYLHEFKDGYTGYKDTNDYYTEYFGRTLDLMDDPVRVNRLNLSKSWLGYTLTGEFLWYDDVIARRQGDEDTTLQRLPSIDFNLLKQQIFDSVFYQDLNAAYTHFYREKGSRGHRLDAYMRFYLPYRLKNILTLEPSLGLRQTAWHMDKFEGESGEINRTTTRGMYDLRFDLSTEFYRIFNVSKAPGGRIKHSIRPQVVYDYVPNISQDKFPYFDALDRIPEKDLLTYSISTLLISRSEKQEGTNPIETRTQSSFDYRQFFSLELLQQYDFNKTGIQDAEPFSPIFTRLQYSPLNYFLLDVETQYSTYEHQFVSRNAALHVYDRRGDRLFVEYRYTEDKKDINNLESIILSADVKVFAGLSVFGSYEGNLYEGKKIKSEIGFLYQTQCWLMNIRYWEEEDDFKIRFSLKLLGLGDIS